MEHSALFLEFLSKLKPVEGGYSNNPKDAGGETMHGITIAVARKHGYSGPMKLMPYSIAQSIYFEDYWQSLNLEIIGKLTPSVALKMGDIGVNCGVNRAGRWFQRCLNVLNNKDARGLKPWPDLAVDGDIGQRSINAYRAFVVKRKAEGELVFFRMLNNCQGNHYIETAEKLPQNEEFVYGWFRTRIA